MASESEQEKRETLADIVAEYRNDADAMDRGELYQPTTEYLRRLLDRIEAIDSADAWRSLYSPGNVAAIREALKAIHDKVNGLDEECGVDPVEIRDIARAALAAPARQCDVGTPAEQERRYKATGEVYHTLTLTNALAWAQTPCEAQEGGAS